MKAICKVGFVVWLVVVGGCGEASRTTSSPPPVVGPFSVLDAYGQWIEYPGYGQVWQPRVGYDWQPFVEGRWMWTDRGWLWYSNEPFGWVVYHYGFWVDEGAAGWLWVPGYDWSPARVTWVVGDDMIGWAPEPPPGRRHPLGPADRGLVVVSTRHFMNRDVGRYRVPTPSNENLPRREPVQRQPDVRLVERSWGRAIGETRFETEHVPAGNRNLIRIRIPDTESDANEPTMGRGATSSHPPVLPPAATPRGKPPTTEPAKPVPPAKTGGSKVDRVNPRPPKEKRRPEKEKKAMKDKKGRRENRENRDKKEAKEPSDAPKK